MKNKNTKKYSSVFVSDRLLVHVFFLQVIIFISCISTSFFSKMNIGQDILFFIIQLFLLFLPGLAICLYFDIHIKRVEHLVSFSYVFGLILTIIEYYVVAIIKIWLLARVLFLLVSIVSVVIIYKNRRKLLNTECDNFSLFSFLLVIIIVVIDLYTVTLANPFPVDYSAVTYNKDFMYWVGNSLSFMKGLPVQDFRLVGIPFYYHYFSNIIVAFQSLVCGISVVDLSFCFTYVIPAVLLSYCSLVLFDTIANSKPVIIIGVILSLFTEGSVIYMASHLYFCPFGFDYAYAVAMLAIAHLIDMYKEDDYSIKNMIVSCLLIMFTTGLKGPVAIVVLIAYGVIAFNMLIKKQWKYGFLCGLSWLLSFIFVYLFFIVDFTGNTETVNDLMFMGPFAAFDNNVWAIDILNDLIYANGLSDNGLTRLLALFLYVIRNNIGSIILLLVGCFAFIYQAIKRKMDIVLLSLIAISLWAILLTTNTYQVGNSQAYFVMSCFPYAAASGLYVLDHYFGFNKLISIVVVILVLLLSYQDVARFANDRVNYSILSAIRTVDGLAPNNKGLVLSNEDYNMAVWLKNNTEENDVVALDCFAFGDINKEEGIGVFSERFIWNDGKYGYAPERDRRRQIIDRLYSGDLNVVEQLKKENVRYLIQTISVHPQSINNIETVYTSDVYIIYKLY